MIKKGICPKEIISNFKKEFPNRSLFKITKVDPKTQKTHEIVYTAMTREISKVAKAIANGNQDHSVVSLEDPYDKAQIYIYQECVLFPKLEPEDMMSLDVGDLPSMIAKITEKSGFDGIDFRGFRVGGIDPQTTLLNAEQIAPYPDQDVIDKITKEYSGIRLWLMRCGLKYFICKPLTRQELRTAREEDDEVLSILKSCVVYPKDYDWNSSVAGLDLALSAKISKLGGYDLVDTEEIEL